MSKGVPSAKNSRKENDMSSYLASANREREIESKKKATEKMKQRMQPALEEFLGGKVLDYEKRTSNDFPKINIDTVKSNTANNRNFNILLGSEKNIDNSRRLRGSYDFSPQPGPDMPNKIIGLPIFNNDNNSLIRASSDRPFYVRRKAGQIYD